MKKILIAIFSLLLIMAGCAFVRRPSTSILKENLSSKEKNNYPLSHEDSVCEFIEWYEAMTENFLSIYTLEELKKIGPEKMLELNYRFSHWHIKLTDDDTKNIKDCFKKSIRDLARHSLYMKGSNGKQIEHLSQEQVDYAIYLGELGTDLVLDTTTYLDYLVLWTKDHYNPPLE